MTGASDGMGLVIATRLAAAGAEMILPVRNERKGAAAAAAIRRQVPSARVRTSAMDLSSLRSVARFGQELADEGAPIHLLVNNAGVMTPPERQVTEDGFELQLGTNHLGHVALVAHLLPLLREGRARVVSQLSVAARSGSINWDDLNWETSYDAMRAYRQSKIALGLFGLELQRRSSAGGWGISSLIAHPGVAPTSLLSARPELGRERAASGRGLIALLSRVGLVGTVESAGLSALYAATSPHAEGGRFYGPRRPGGMAGPPGELSVWRPLVTEDATRMWEVSERLSGVTL
ncbi:NAD(P)-dependent dehydrogenase (short-subunit alcohol dehydrogenase family) [Nocardioides nitrophenolicus]|nr:NAD(P)-dependent dehydrogenase (short-subunit alcohol dehydrogenase family) [Nocardioides nitrophenolicus]